MGRETRWRYIEAGMYVKDKTGKTWRVEDKRWTNDDKLMFLLLDREGRKVAYNAWLAGEVIVLEPTEEEALATVRDLLGAEVVMVQDYPKKPGYCAPITVNTNLADIQNHLSYFHRIYRKSGPGSRLRERLIAEHEEEHSKAGPALVNSGNYHRHTR